MTDNRTSGSEEWMTKAEIAARLKCTPRYINTLMRRGILPYLKTRGLLRFDPEDCSLALKAFKTRSRFALENRTTAVSPCLIAPGTLAAPLAINPSLPAQKICAQVFESPEHARKYLDELIRSGPSVLELPTSEAQNQKAPITVIILQSTPAP
jgi:hypothetical protein